MSEVGKGFALLQARGPQLEGNQVWTRELGLQTPEGEVLLAVDADQRQRLLVPTARTSLPEDRTSSGVSLGQRQLQVAEASVTYADLCCEAEGLELVFQRLADDVVSRLETTQLDGYVVCRQVLGEWRELLKLAGKPLPREKVLGLVGELEALRRLAATDPVLSLDSWVGPANATHDFTCGRHSLEIKTSAADNAKQVGISSLEQLDPAGRDSLHLAFMQAQESPDAPSLDDRIADLLQLGLPRDQLLEKVAAAGYVYESRAQSSDRFEIAACRIWPIYSDSPGLRTSEIDALRMKGISGVTYSLQLDAMPNEIEPGLVQRFFEAWIGSPT